MNKKYIMLPILAFLLLAGLIFVSFALRTSLPTNEPAAPSHPPFQTPTPDQKAVLNVPLHNATVQERMIHAAYVEKLAQTAPILDITGCKPDPLVYKVNLKGSFQVRNGDAVPHSLRYGSFMVTIPSQATTTVKTSRLFQKAGDYGYGCDNPFAKMGVLMVR